MQRQNVPDRDANQRDRVFQVAWVSAFSTYLDRIPGPIQAITPDLDWILVGIGSFPAFRLAVAPSKRKAEFWKDIEHPALL